MITLHVLRHQLLVVVYSTSKTSKLTSKMLHYNVFPQPQSNLGPPIASKVFGPESRLLESSQSVLI